MPPNTQKIHRILFAPRRKEGSSLLSAHTATVTSSPGRTPTAVKSILTGRKPPKCSLYLVTIDIKAAFTHNRLKIEGQPLTLIPSIDSETLGIPGRPPDNCENRSPRKEPAVRYAVGLPAPTCCHPVAKDQLLKEYPPMKTPSGD